MNGEVKGIFNTTMEYALQHYDTIRIDTHRDNKVMQHAIAKAGFEYCGIIHCWNRRTKQKQSGACSNYAESRQKKAEGQLK